MDDVKITGFLNYEVKVRCPHCNGRLDLNMHPYVDCENSNILELAIFGSKTRLAQWNDIYLKYNCNHCKKDFILEKIEY